VGFREEGMAMSGNDGQSGREWTDMHFPRTNTYPQPGEFSHFRYPDNHISPILSEQRSSLTNSSGSNTQRNSVEYQQQQRDGYSSPFGIRQLTTTNSKTEMPPVNMGKRSNSATALTTQLNSPLPSHQRLIHSLPRPSASVPSFDIHYYQAIHPDSKVPTSESAPEMDTSPQQNINSNQYDNSTSSSQSFDSRIFSSLMDTKPAYGTVFVQHYSNDQAYNNDSYKYPGSFREQDYDKSSKNQQQHHQEHRHNINQYHQEHRNNNTHFPDQHHQEHRTNNTHLPDQHHQEGFHGRYIQLTNPENPSYYNLNPGNMNNGHVVERYQLGNI